MTTTWRFLAAVSLLGIHAGCKPIGGSPPEAVSRVEESAFPGESGEAGMLDARPGFQRAQELSSSVKVGTTQGVVEAMFGPPDKAGYKTYGRATQTAWRALVWEWVFQDVTPPRALSIVFQEDGAGTWRGNHGDWPE